MLQILSAYMSSTESGITNSLCIVLRSYHTHLKWKIPSAKNSNLGVIMSRPVCGNSFNARRHGRKVVSFALDTGGIPNNNGQPDSFGGDGNGNAEGDGDGGQGLDQTRLGRIASAAGRQLLAKLNAARRRFPMKLFLLLLGFYTANALATILGQTGDWDVLVAGVVVAAIEGIGVLMYRKPPFSSPLFSAGGRLQSLVVMINYWKAGVCLGLFVDAFKLGS